MQPNVIFFGWNRSTPGREKISAQHFQEFVQYLAGLQQAGTIASFAPFFLEPHGGDLNGFFLIHGKPANLSDLMSSKDWAKHMMRASLHLDNVGTVTGFTGDAVTEQMELWTSLLP